MVCTGLLTVDGPDAVLVSSNPYQFDDPAGLGRRAHLDSGLLGVLTARAETPAETAARLRGGQPHNLAGLATPDDVVVYAAAPAPRRAGRRSRRTADSRAVSNQPSSTPGMDSPASSRRPACRAIAGVGRHPAGGLNLGEPLPLTAHARRKPLPVRSPAKP